MLVLGAVLLVVDHRIPLVLPHHHAAVELPRVGVVVHLYAGAVAAVQGRAVVEEELPVAVGLGALADQLCVDAGRDLAPGAGVRAFF